jgi:hypothetical protein
MSVVMGYLNARTPRELVLDRQEPRFKQLERFFNKIRVDVRTGLRGEHLRVKTIHGLEPMAGEFELHALAPLAGCEVRRALDLCEYFFFIVPMHVLISNIFHRLLSSSVTNR